MIKFRNQDGVELFQMDDKGDLQFEDKKIEEEYNNSEAKLINDNKDK